MQLGGYVNDKVLHFTTFFILTAVFYFILDTNRRRTLNLTLIVCTLILGVGSEFVQSFLPNDRDFDLYDIVANLGGSLLALGLCSWYHKRMLERRRQHKTYGAVPGEDIEDVELANGQETGITSEHERNMTMEEEVDNWDEHAADDDWQDDAATEIGTTGESAKGKEPEGADIGTQKGD